GGLPVAFVLVLDLVQQQTNVAPGQMCHRLWHICVHAWPGLGEGAHVHQIPPRESRHVRELVPQVLRQSLDDTSPPPGRSLLLQDRVAYLPVQRDQLSVDRPACRASRGTYLPGERAQNIAITGRQIKLGGHAPTLALE